VVQFNFDIVIIIIAFFLFVIGIYRGFYHQTFTTISLIVPVFVIYFFKDKVLSLFQTISNYESIINSIHRVTKYFLNLDIVALESFLVILITFIVVYLLMKLILLPFKRMNFRNNNHLSRLLGGAMGLVGAVVFVLLAFVLIVPISEFSQATPLTAAFIKLIPEVFKVGML